VILSDVHLEHCLKEGEIIVDPLADGAIQPASIDLRLDRHFLVFDRDKNVIIDPREPLDDKMREITIGHDSPFILHPGAFALGLVYEKTGVDAQHVGMLDGKSSVGRLGVLVHATAGYLDPGNCLKMTLELHNVANMPVLLYYMMPIAQMVFFELTTQCRNPYTAKSGGKYVGDMKPKASQMWRNFTKDSDA